MAVDRNRARRRLKEAVRAYTFWPHAQPGFDYTVIGRTAALTRDFAVLLADMETAFRKVAPARTQRRPRDAGWPEPTKGLPPPPSLSHGRGDALSMAATGLPSVLSPSRIR